MPRERIGRSMSHDKSRGSPYPCSSSHGKRFPSKSPSESVETIKEWEEARCPVCIEHPHNAVLLHCSSHDKGCHPYICDTSYRHSNCLDQFRKAFSESPSEPTPSESSYLSYVTHTMSPGQNTVLHQDDEDHNLQPGPCEGEEKPNLSCPLCRGEIKGWTVVEPARKFMNAKSRSCSHESCVFSGTYADLRKHARLEHPSARPSEVDQKRQREWRRLERQRDLGDLLSTIQSAFGEEERGEESSPFHVDEGSWLTIYFLIRIFQPSSRRSQRRRILLGESYESESRSAAAREDNNGGSGGVPGGTWCHHEQQSHQRTTPDSEP